jgi:GR25 family glycosyltransferase involved in LPS biosynthesis
MTVKNPISYLKYLKAFFDKGKNLRFYYNLIIIKRSKFFDEDYYIYNNQDVKTSGISTICHFLLYGAQEGRNPSDKFNTKFYLENYSDVLESGLNPLVHYLNFGIKENRVLIKPNEEVQSVTQLTTESPFFVQKANYSYSIDIVHSQKVKSFVLKNNGKTEFINSYFDNIYVINLRRCQNKLTETLQKLKKLNISAEIIEAVDGYESPNIDEYQKYQSLPLGMNDSHPREIKLNRKLIYSPGVWGHLKSNRLIINDAIVRGYNKILILEDDVVFIQNFHNEFQRFTTSIFDKTWKFLYLGASQNCWKIPECLVYPDSNILNFLPEQPYYHPVSTNGSFAIGIDNSQFKSIINNIDKMNCAFDSSYHSIYNQCIDECFVAQPNLIVSDVSMSDNRTNRTSKDQYIMAETYKWDMSLYDYPFQKEVVSVIMPA